MIEKQAASQESNAQELSFKWSHFRVSSTERNKNFEHFVQHKEQYHANLLLSSFYLNGHTSAEVPSAESKVTTTLHIKINGTT